ncbi:ABC transporter substrate-binding protein [Patulibacter defluvii]|uniref:ABC transporter substrate-binding protein n=1 Tax=Patulibacter defluvii TaxID=3095358 RepID=UPI002A7632F2|nr:ABC transporter substrate-binding protein [Patulibacter sp. DM4]
MGPEFNGRMTRRGALRMAGAGVALLGGSSLLTACGSGSGDSGGGGGSEVTDQLGWLKLSQFDGFFAAQEKGYYKAEGLSVDVRAGGPNIIASQVVSNGKATVGNDDNGTVLQAIAKGTKLVIYGTIFQKSPYAVLSLPGKPVRTLADFAGKKVALSPATRPLLEPLLKKAGVDPGDVKFLPAGPDPAQLVNKQVDAYFGYATQQGISLQQQGVQVVSVLLDDLGLHNYGNVLITTPDRVKNDRELLVKHLRASIKGWEYAVAHPDEMGKLVATKYGPRGLKPATEIAVNKAQAPLIQSADGLMRITEERMQQIIDSYVAAKALAKPLKAADVMTTEILDAAFDGKTTLSGA